MTKKVASIIVIALLIIVGAYGCITKNNNTTGRAMVMSESNGQVNSGYPTNASSKSMRSNMAIPAVAPSMVDTNIQNDNTSGIGGAQDASGSTAQTPNTPTASTTVGQVTINNHKIVQTGDISMETLKFEDSVSKATEYAKSIGGYEASSNVQGQGIDSQNNARKRTANFEFRIPSSKYSEFFTKIKDYGVVTSEQSNGQDITENYMDTEARLKSLQVQEDRELELVKTATKLSDIIELERELNNVRYQIESYTGTLKKWDSLVDYSTIRLSISEVDESKTIAPQKAQGLWSRMDYSFTESAKNLVVLVENLIITITAIIPFAIVIGIIIAFVLISKRVYKAFKK